MPRFPGRVRPLAALILLAAAPAHAIDYVWLGQVGNGNWFSNNQFANNAWTYNWTPSGPPPYGTPATVLIDNDPGKSSKVQVAPFTYVAPTPGCSGLGCGVSAGANRLVIDSGDTVVVGGSIPFADGAYYANGQSRLEIIDTGSGGAIVNNGTLRLSSEGNNAVLAIRGVVTLSGSGETVLGNGYDAASARKSFNANQIVYGAGSAAGSSVPPKLIIEAGHTLRGSGKLGYNGSLAIENRGSIVADGPTELMVSGLSTGPYTVTNAGLMQARSGGRLWTTSAVDNSGGVIEALDGSVVDAGVGILGGTLRTGGSGVIRTLGTNAAATFLTGVTLEGHLHVADGIHVNTGMNGAANAIVNNGLISLGGPKPGEVPVITGSTMTLYGDTTFAGNGRIELTDDANNKIAGYGNYIGRAPVMTLGAGQTMSGAGELKTSLVNQGRIEANGAVNGFKVGNGGLLTNQGEIVVSGTAPVGFAVNGGQFQNQATFTVEAGATFSGMMSQSAGVTAIQGTADAASILMLTGGVLKGGGTVLGQVTNMGGVVAPGNSPGTLTVARYTQSSGDLVLEIDGDGYAQRDHLVITGNASFFGGRVVLDFSDYTGSGSLSFADILTVGGILRLSHPSTGAASVFEVVGLAGGRTAALAWNDGILGVTVSAPVPEPETYALMLAGLGLLGWKLSSRRT